MNLRHIDFGRDSAELDNRLVEFFLETPVYEAVIDGGKSIVIGRKGTGKTAILKYSRDTENSSHEYVIPIEATHSTYVRVDENLRSFAGQIKNIDSSFKLGWLFTTLLALVERLTAEASLYVTKEEARLHEFAKRELGYTSSDAISAIAGYATEWIKNLKRIGPVERGDGGAREVAFDEVQVLALIRTALERINDKGKRVLLLYDRLDDRWDGSDLYRAFLQGLFLAARDVKALGCRVAPVVFMRDDIFDEVIRGFQHIDHFRLEIQRIDWDEESLRDLLALRIKKSLSSKGHRVTDLSADEAWGLIFPPALPAKRQPIPTTAYMIERTLFRPRDIIVFATYARDEAVARRHDTISVGDIQKAEEKYSRDKLKDLVNEYSYKYEGLDQVLEHFRGRKIGFDLDDLRLLVLEMKESLESGFAWLGASEDDLIRLLYALGFLSYTTRGGTLRGTRVIHSGNNRDDRAVLNQARVYVSPIFRKALDMDGS